MIDFIIAALATYGISSLVTSYDGLYEVFLKLRQKYPHSAFNCPACLSVWFAVIFTLLIYLGFLWLLVPLAIVGVVIILERVL